MNRRFDILVIGGGVLGVTIAFWISELYEVSVAIIDRENSVALHTSSRNTGVVHRPFYLDPDKRGFMARLANISFYMWRSLANRYRLPWMEIGVIEVATSPEEDRVLRKYESWARRNGMDEDEITILDRRDVAALEPEVRCYSAIYSRRDTSTHFGVLTNAVYMLALRNGVGFIPGCNVQGIVAEISGGRYRVICRDRRVYEGDIVIIASGCGSLRILHSLGMALDYGELYFRGDYWIVDPYFGRRVRRNIYRVPKRRDFPFLDPHLVVRYNGSREVGPSATPVIDGYAYNSPCRGLGGFLDFMYGRSVYLKLKAVIDPRFIDLARDEWMSSVSRRHMASRVATFIPALDQKHLVGRGASGVRCQLIDRGGLVLNPKVVVADSIIGVINYNSPGATGAPAFSGFLVYSLASEGFLDGFRERNTYRHSDLWSINSILEGVKERSMKLS